MVVSFADIVRWVLVPAGIAFPIAFVGALVIIRAATRVGIMRKPGGRHVHARPTALLGGVVIAIAFFVAVLLHPDVTLTPQLVGLLLGFFVIVAMGVLDDIRELRWQAELFFQVAAAAIAVAGGMALWHLNNPFGGAIDLSFARIPWFDFACAAPPCFLPLVGAVLTVFWIVAVTNAVNWLDGSDGIAGSVSILAFLALGVLSVRPDVMQPALLIVAAAAAWATAGVLPFNLPPARLFLGTSGAMGLGFLVAGLAVMAGAKVATASMVLLLPAADMAFVIAARLWQKQPITQPDTRHFHFWLRKQGMAPWQRLLAVLALTSVFAFLAVALPHPAKAMVLGGLGILLFILFAAARLPR